MAPFMKRLIGLLALLIPVAFWALPASAQIPVPNLTVGVNGSQAPQDMAVTLQVIAMLTVLETLGPAERAVFVLREVFDTPYDEIAEVIGKSPAAVRQIAHRAREHVAARRPRMQGSPAEQRAVVERFLAVLQTGDVQGLLDVLAPGVVFRADGGGVADAVRRPIAGARSVARLLAMFPKLAPHARISTLWLNGAPAARIDVDGDCTAISLVIEDGKITRLYAMRNPHKLGGLAMEAELTR